MVRFSNNSKMENVVVITRRVQDSSSQAMRGFCFHTWLKVSGMLGKRWRKKRNTVPIGTGHPARPDLAALVPPFHP